MSSFRRLAVVSLVVAGLAAGGTAPSFAYRMTGPGPSFLPVACNDPGGFIRWDVRNIGYYLNPAGQGADKAPALQSAMQSWSNVPSAAHVLRYVGTTTRSGTVLDGFNTISWGTHGACPSGCLAVTATVSMGQQIVDTDIVFSTAGLTWKTDGTNWDTQAVAAHELGHSLGIDHTEVTFSPLPSMRNTYFGVDGRSLEADDAAALQCSESRYPQPPPAYKGFYGAGRFDCRGAKGWAWNANTPNNDTFVDILYNGALFLTVAADQFRQDLYDAGIGDGYHSFEYNVSPSVKGPIEVRAVHAGTSQDLNLSPRTLYCRMNALSNLTPAELNHAAGAGYEFATEFSSAISGYVMALRFYKAPGETGVHTGRLWTDTGTLLASVTYASETASGWQPQVLPTPVFIQAGVRYRVSYNMNTYKSRTYCGLSSPHTQYPLTAHSGYSSTVAGIFPATQTCNNFFADVRFDQ